jgi:signal transduction histidine kinase
MVLGIISFVVIMTVIIASAAFLVREIMEVRRQTTFIDAVTHELKSPLASLRLCAETLSRPQLDEDRRSQLRSMMVRDVERLVGVVDGILEATRLVAGKVASSRSQIDLKELLDECTTTVERRHGLDMGTLQVTGDPRGPIVSDAAALSTIIENLLDNAVKYAKPDQGPKVRVHLGSAPKDRVVLEVTDDGIGIPHKDLRRIFNRFYRAPEEAVRARHGTGLGLFVVASLVKNMGGRIDALSRGSGHGATFRIELPRRPKN